MNNGSNDVVIMAVLDQILEDTQIDPSCIAPDYKLGLDFGLSRVQVQTIYYNAARKLSLPVTFEMCRIEDASARDLVNRIRRMAATHGVRVA